MNQSESAVEIYLIAHWLAASLEPSKLLTVRQLWWMVLFSIVWRGLFDHFSSARLILAHIETQVSQIMRAVESTQCGTVKKQENKQADFPIVALEMLTQRVPQIHCDYLQPHATVRQVFRDFFFNFYLIIVWKKRVGIFSSVIECSYGHTETVF